MGDTRERILCAARTVFARTGLDRATLRQIAEAADVDPALMAYYFRSKEELFYEGFRSGTFDQVLAILRAPADPHPLGDRLVREFLKLWESKEDRAVLIGFFRTLCANERVAGRLREFVERELPKEIGGRASRDHLRLRVALVTSELIGLSILRYVVPMEPVAKASRPMLTRAVGPTLTRYLRGPLH